jgi:hypothetical protein
MRRLVAVRFVMVVTIFIGARRGLVTSGTAFCI